MNQALANHAADRVATIMILDDDPMIRFMATRALTEAGYQIVSAASAEAGIAIFDEAMPDLVLMDILLPGINGFEACAHLRQLPAGQHLPIIVMTGLEDRESVVTAFQSGATDFITKPIVWALLPFRVRYALRASAALRLSMRSQSLLASAQRIAIMGSWEWQVRRDTFTCSDELHRIHGADPRTGEAGVSALIQIVHAEDRDAIELLLERAGRDGQAYSVEFRIVRQDGEVRHLFEQTDIERDAAGDVLTVRGIRQDITARIDSACRIHSLAYFDPLTGLANSTLFRERMGHWLAHTRRQGMRCALVMLELDRFTQITGSLGPRIGDEVLKEVGKRLAHCLRVGESIAVADHAREDLLARLNGAEFIIGLVGIGSPRDALSVARRMSDAISRPIAIDQHVITVTTVLGLSITPDGGLEVDTLMQNAETALRRAQEAGGWRAYLYSQEMSEAVTRRHHIENDLRRALDHDGFVVHYQAKIDARDNHVVGAEALLRLNHPERGVEAPGTFIAIAEDSGLIVPIFDWVVRTVCAQQAAWRDAGLTLVPVSVNLDGKSLQSEGMHERIGGAIARAGIDAAMLELEVTESCLMKDVAASARTLGQLRNKGIRIAIDDFGTGYSSLTHLKRFPIDILKIDRSFIKDLPDDTEDAALTSAIIAMGKILKLELIAEGVETAAQAEFLVRQGCYLHQGFLFSRAEPADEFGQIMQACVPPIGLENARAAVNG
jgi:diguanylate cyclase (GGDEF)-like protein/PAS domain S-box-containing protein